VSNWKIDVEPEGKNEDNRNEGAAIVFLTDGTQREEIGAVAFARRHAAHPDKTFDDALDELVAKGRKVLKVKRELAALVGDTDGLL
jgi:hypothetical protein